MADAGLFLGFFTALVTFTVTAYATWKASVADSHDQEAKVLLEGWRSFQLDTMREIDRMERRTRSGQVTPKPRQCTFCGAPLKSATCDYCRQEIR